MTSSDRRAYPGAAAPVPELGLLMSSGDYLLRSRGAHVEQIYPAAEWARHQKVTGGHVFRRVVVVIEDWTEI